MVNLRPDELRRFLRGTIVRITSVAPLPSSPVCLEASLCLIVITAVIKLQGIPWNRNIHDTVYRVEKKELVMKESVELPAYGAVNMWIPHTRLSIKKGGKPPDAKFQVNNTVRTSTVCHEHSQRIAPGIYDRAA